MRAASLAPSSASDAARSLTGETRPAEASRVGKVLLRWLVLGTLIGIAAGAIAGVVLSRFVQLPAVEALTAYQPSAATLVEAADSTVVASFATERRIPVPPEQIPQVFRNAVLAAEDANFYHHPGIDPKGMIRAAILNMFHRRWAQGASTLTQQLARTLFLNPEKKLIRKLKEILLAIEIEQKFSKDQILTMYINQVYFGHGAYGVEAASRFFFGKSAVKLTVPEAALLAGIIQRNNLQSPIRYPERALARRNYVLGRMLDEGMIDRAAYKAALQAPLGAKAHYDRSPTAAYFTEEVRRSIEERFGTRSMLEGGLTVETTLDRDLQTLAEQCLRNGLVELQRRLGWQGARINVLQSEHADLQRWSHPSWAFLQWQRGELAYALVTEVQAKVAEMRIGNRSARLPVEGAEWTGRTTMTRLVQPGDVILVRLGDVPADPGAPVTVTLEPEPTVEGAMVVLDNRTGEVLALVGGFDFDRSQFDRAIQAKRQCGSAFKPFVFMAAFEHGYSPNDTIFDGPVLLPDENNELTYVPLDYYKRYEGIVTLRYAVEHSLNASAVKLEQMVTPQAVIDVARRFGIDEELHPYASLALGSVELPLVELTAAYAGIANRGQVATPYLIRKVKDSRGQTVLENRPKVRQAVDPVVAYLMTHVLEGVIQRGTGVAAADLPGHLAGKTGTTDWYTDAWFIGYTPRITCGVWVGRDAKERIGRNMSGADAALPTWMAFMRGYLAHLPKRAREEDFPVPPRVVFTTVDPRTGLRAVPACGSNVILEAVREDTPIQDCSATWHDIIALPWEQQLAYYTYKPGEPLVTPQAIIAAAIKLEEKNNPQPTPTPEP
jgi:penicillin-binding protein 1A